MSQPADPFSIDVDRVRTDGVATRVTRITTDSADDAASFVLVAGIGVASTYFEFLAPVLAERGDVYALDLPGFAGMPRPHGQPSTGFFADQVEGVIAHYGIRHPVLIGHSMGTQVVTELLIRHPEYAHGVLVSPVIDESAPSLPAQAVRFARSAVHETVHLALTALSAYILCGFVYFLTVLPYMMRYRISERIRLPEARILLIRGQYDRSSTRRFHDRLRKRARNAIAWEIEGAAHSIINAHAVGVAKLTLGLIDDDLAPRGRMSSEEARVPEAQRGGIALLLSASGSRVAEWVSSLRGDEDGVERAKREHAKVLWRAFTRSGSADGS